MRKHKGSTWPAMQSYGVYFLSDIDAFYACKGRLKEKINLIFKRMQKGSTAAHELQMVNGDLPMLL